MFTGNLISPPHMEDRCQHIIARARDIFKKYGIKSVTMDDMAREQGMSKKTLYQCVSDKNDLVHRAILTQLNEERQHCTAVMEKGLDAIDELFEIGRFISGMLKDLHPSIHYDLEKYHPNTFHALLSGHREFVFDCMLRNMEKGISQGLYRANLNTKTIARLYILKMDGIFDPEIFPPAEISFQQVYHTQFEYHIRGIASPKGLEKLADKLDTL